MKNCMIYFLLFFVGVLGAKCQSGEKKKDLIPLNQQDRIFKKWLVDTLTILNKEPSKLNEKLTSSKIIVADDSLSFNIIKAYEFSSMEGTKGPVVTNILSLLKDYDELPRVNYFLSFNTEELFYTSTSPNLKYDFVSEIKGIKIRTAESNIDYKYIRGRLSGKRIQSNSKAHNKKAILYDFDWNGGKLLKKKLNSSLIMGQGFMIR